MSMAAGACATTFAHMHNCSSRRGAGVLGILAHAGAQQVAYTRALHRAEASTRCVPAIKHTPRACHQAHASCLLSSTRLVPAIKHTLRACHQAHAACPPSSTRCVPAIKPHTCTLHREDGSNTSGSRAAASGGSSAASPQHHDGHNAMQHHAGCVEGQRVQHAGQLLRLARRTGG